MTEKLPDVVALEPLLIVFAPDCGTGATVGSGVVTAGE